MDFSAWSPSHLIVAGLALATIIGQTIAVLARLKTTTERLENQGKMFVHAMERLENRLDKRVDEVRAERSEIRPELSKLNQNHIDHLTHHQTEK